MRLLFIICCFLSVTASAQDLSGIWRGHFRSSNSRMLQLLGEEDRYKFEVQLDQKNRKFSGVTYSYKTTVFYGKATCIGTVNPSTRKVLLEELKIVEVRMAGGDACIMTCFLQYTKSGDEEFLEGTYTSMNTRDSSNCGKGTLFLRKVSTSDFFKEPFIVKREKELEKKRSAPPVTRKPSEKPDVVTSKPNNGTVTKPRTTPAPTPKKTEPPVVAKKSNDGPAESSSRQTPVRIDSSGRKATVKRPTIPVPKVIASRANELVKTIDVSEGKILVNLYDNGTIDNDTVSVYVNNRLMISKQRLTASPLVLSFDINEEEPEVELVMVAENLGEIPPNTSLMVVKAEGKQYEVRITSNEQKNAVVRFQLSQAP